MAKAKRKTLIATLVAILIAILTLAGVAWWRAQGGDDEPSGQAAVRAPEPDPEQALEYERAPAEPLERVRVSGRVTRADHHTGIAGAVVLLSRKDIVQGQAPHPGEPTWPLTAITDANGDWQLAAVDPGRYNVSATALGFAPATGELRISGAQGSVDLAMLPGGTLLAGTISDIDGSPIEGALVRLTDRAQFQFGFDQAPLAAISNEAGEYRLHLGSGRYSISASHPDYVAEARLTEASDSGRREDFRLIPGATIEGVVLARADGKAVAGARVTYSDAGTSARPLGVASNVSVDGSVVVSDEAGRFRLTGVRAGEVEVLARARHHASTAPEQVALGIGETVREVELWVDSAYTISGFVAAKDDPKAAIDGVLVGAWQMQPFNLLIASAPTRSDGYFEIVGVRPGPWQIGAMAEEHLFSLSGATINVSDHDLGELSIALETGVYVRGRVEPGGRARVRVQLDPDAISLPNLGQNIADLLASSLANESGAFELGPLSPSTGFGGRALTLVASNDQGFRGQITVQLGREDLERVVLRMNEGAMVSGTVLDDEGVPQSAVVVSITPVEREPSDGLLDFGALDDAAPTDEEGRFSVRGLGPGEHQIVVEDRKGRPLRWAEGEGEESIRPRTITIEDPGEQLLELRVTPRDAEIAGVVLDAEGLPVADAWVLASRSAPEPSRWLSELPVLSDENGLFVLKNLERNRHYRVTAEGERGAARATVESAAPNTRVTLTLEQLSALEGVVTFAGEPVEEYSVTLSGPTPRAKQVVHPRGQFALERLDPGNYQLSVRSEAGTGEATIELGEARRASVKIELEQAP